MIITIPAQAQAHSGPRLINLNTDIPQVLELLELSFGESMDEEGRRLLAGQSGMAQAPAVFWRLSPAASRLALSYVWEENGRIIGNVTLLNTQQAGRYLIVNVAVHPNHRRRGIARMLMQGVLNMVRERGGYQILLQVVKTNTPAIDLYKSLRFVTLGSMTNWHSTAARVRQLAVPADKNSNNFIRELRGGEWLDAFELDQTALHPDLNWPETLPHDVYRKGFWRRLTDFLNGCQSEAWTITDANGRLTALASIWMQWGKSHQFTMRVHPNWRGSLERPLLAKLLRRLQYLPRRNVQIEHPDDDELMNQLLQEANFQSRRTLTHMRLDL